MYTFYNSLILKKDIITQYIILFFLILLNLDFLKKMNLKKYVLIAHKFFCPYYSRIHFLLLLLFFNLFSFVSCATYSH